MKSQIPNDWSCFRDKTQEIEPGPTNETLRPCLFQINFSCLIFSFHRGWESWFHKYSWLVSRPELGLIYSTASGHFLPCAFILSVENSTEMLFFQISTKAMLSPLQSEGPSAVDLSGRSFAFWKASSREILQSAANDSLLSPSHHHQHRLLTDISLSINIWHLSLYLFPSSLIIIWKNSFCHLRFLVDHSSAAAAVVADGGNCLPSLLTPTSDASQISG